MRLLHEVKSCFIIILLEDFIASRYFKMLTCMRIKQNHELFNLEEEWIEFICKRIYEDNKSIF